MLELTVDEDGRGRVVVARSMVSTLDVDVAEGRRVGTVLLRVGSAVVISTVVKEILVTSVAIAVRLEPFVCELSVGMNDALGRLVDT